MLRGRREFRESHHIHEKIALLPVESVMKPSEYLPTPTAVWAKPRALWLLDNTGCLLYLHEFMYGGPFYKKNQHQGAPQVIEP